MVRKNNQRPVPGYRVAIPGPISQGPVPPTRSKRRRITDGLIGLSSAAIISVYSIGYVHTRGAANQASAAEAAASIIATSTPRTVPTISTASTATASQPPTSQAATPQGSSVPPTVSQQSATAGQQQSPPTSVRPTATTQVAPTLTPPTAGQQPAQAAPATATTAPAQSAGQPLPSATSAPATATSRPATATATTVPANSSQTTYRDGTYTGQGTSNHGDIQATVVVKNGAIVSAAVSHCGTQYSCSYVAPLITEVVTRQSAPVHYVSGATASSSAYRQAILKALAQAT